MAIDPDLLAEIRAAAKKIAAAAPPLSERQRNVIRLAFANHHQKEPHA